MTIYVATRADAHLGTTQFGVLREGPGGGLRQFGTAWYAPGSRLHCSRREIPQVGETYAVVGVPSDGWGFESGVNEHALAVGCEPIATREPPEVGVGLSAHDLVRLALERGRNAREALEVLAALIERFGCGVPEGERHGAGNDHRFFFGDPGEAWGLECAARRWAARRVSRRLPGRGTQGKSGLWPEIRDNWEIGSKGLEAYARERHWCEGPGRLDFSAVYRDDPPPRGTARGDDRSAETSARSERRIAGSVGRGDLEALLREDGGGAASFSVALPHDRRRPWPLWLSAGPASVGLFLPVYLDALLPPHALPEGGGSFAALAESAESHSEIAEPRLREAWKGFEADLERERREVEREVTTLFNTERDLEAQERLGSFTAALWSRAASRAAELAGALSGA